jgi:hypothetical protein
MYYTSILKAELYYGLLLVCNTQGGSVGILNYMNCELKKSGDQLKAPTWLVTYRKSSDLIDLDSLYNAACVNLHRTLLIACHGSIAFAFYMVALELY